MRRILDATPLNIYLPRLRQHLPTIKGVMWSIENGDLVLTLDLKGAYSQVRLYPSSLKYCGVIAGDKVFGYMTLPFGLRTSVAVFTNFMSTWRGFLSWQCI